MAVAISMSVGIVMTASAQTASDDDASTPAAATALDTPVPGWAVLDHLVAAGILPPQAAEAIVRVRLERSEWATAGSVCRRVAAAEGAPASLVERCRVWLSSETAGPSALAVCRRIASAESVATSLGERCRAIVADGVPNRPTEHPTERPTERPRRPARSATR